LLLNAVRKKIREYKPETEAMPFHYLLLGKERYQVFSFIQSMNTTLGTSIWEQLAVILGRHDGNTAEKQIDLVGEIDTSTESLIQETYSRLRNRTAAPNKDVETETIRGSVRPGRQLHDADSRVDFFLRSGGEENYFDITSAKPNKKEFVSLKLKLLRWDGLRLSQDKNAKIQTRLAIPYNPYHPKPYFRWTAEGLYDISKGEVLVGEQFWNFVAGGDVYDELLAIFKKAGEVLSDELSAKFKMLS
jgi:hypothetical protein